MHHRFVQYAMLLLLFAGAAFAQSSSSKWPGQLFGIADFNGNQFSSVNPMSTGPAAVQGFGSLAVTNSSVLISTLTLGPNSGAWPPSTVTYLTNDGASAGYLYICPLGGSCGTTGVKLAIGQPYGFRNLSPNATAYAASTATLDAQW
jgi:hypothetical protein